MYIGSEASVSGRLKRILWAATFCVIAMLLMTRGSRADGWGRVTEEEWGLQAPTDQEGIAAIVLFDVGSCVVSYDRVTFTRHVRLKILSAAGAQDASSVKIFRLDEDMFSEFRAQTILPDGEKIKVPGKSVFQKTTGDFVVTTFAFPSVADGAVLEYSYKLRHERFHALDPWYFQGPLYCRQSKFTLEFPEEFTYNYSPVNLPYESGVPAKSVVDHVQKEADRIVHRQILKCEWDLEGIPPNADEPLTAYAQEYRQGLTFSLVSFDAPGFHETYSGDWQSIGARLTEYFAEFSRSDNMVQKVADSVCYGIGDSGSKLRALHSYVRDGIVTQSGRSHISLRAFVHDNLGGVIRERTGSEAEKNLLLVELVKSAGIDASPVLTATRDYGRVHEDVHQFAQFNYLLCRADTGQGNILLDTSDPDIPYPFLPAECVVERGLLVSDSQSAIIDLTPRLRRSSMDISSSIQELDDSSMLCSTLVILTGYYRDHLNHLFKGTIGVAELQEALFPLGQVEFSVIGATAVFDDAGDGLFCQAVLKVTRLGATAGGNRLLPSSPFRVIESPFDSEVRNFPIDFRFPCRAKIVSKVMLVDTGVVVSLPEDIGMETIGGIRVQRSVRRTETGYVSERVLQIEEPIHPVSSYPGIKKALDTFEQCASDAVICRNATGDGE